MVCHDPNYRNMYLNCSNVCEVVSGLVNPRGRHTWTQILFLENLNQYTPVTASYRIWLLQLFLAKCNSFLQTIPPSLKTDCPQKRKQILTRSTWGDGLCKPFVAKLYVYPAGDAWVRTRWVQFIHMFVSTDLTKTIFWTLGV